MTIQDRINRLVKEMNTEILTQKLEETFDDLKLTKLRMSIQMELEERLGMDKTDDLMDVLREKYN